ncbi:MAG: dihydroorotate dehydrogenase [Candidatus Brocadiia bacterium]
MTPRTETDLSVNLADIQLDNPTVLASGVLGLSLELLSRLAECGAGAATIKSISPEPRKGHNGPTVIACEAGMLNAVGYSNPGMEEAAREFREVGMTPLPVFASAIGQEAGEFARVVETLMPCGFDAVELPLSCPHTPGYGVLAGHSTPEATETITRQVAEVTDRPIFVKLSPNVPAIGELVLAAMEGGATGISAVNTLGPGMVIDIPSASPILDFKAGGLSGPALRPVAVRCVYDVYATMKQHNIDAPIIGIGGVSSGAHALEMILAGASAVGVGTGAYQRGPRVFGTIRDELAALCNRHGYNSIKEARGNAHE